MSNLFSKVALISLQMISLCSLALFYSENDMKQMTFGNLNFLCNSISIYHLQWNHSVSLRSFARMSTRCLRFPFQACDDKRISAYHQILSLRLKTVPKKKKQILWKRLFDRIPNQNSNLRLCCIFRVLVNFHEIILTEIWCDFFDWFFQRVRIVFHAIVIRFQYSNES